MVSTPTTTTSSTTTSAVLVEFDMASYTVNESAEVVTVNVKATSAPSVAITGEIHPGKASAVTSGHEQAKSNVDYFAKLPDKTYPTFTIPVGSTAPVAVKIPIQANLIKHTADLDFTVHLKLTGGTTDAAGKKVAKLGTQKTAIVSIHQDQTGAMF